MHIIPLFNKDNYRDSENVWDFMLANQAKLLATPNITTESITTLMKLDFESFVNEDYFIIQYTTPFK